MADVEEIQEYLWENFILHDYSLSEKDNDSWDKWRLGNQGGF